MKEYYAHSENSYGEMEPLQLHLNKTSALAEQFADSFAEGNAGKWIGLFHDVGKASSLFQGVLKGQEHNVNHAAAVAGLLHKFEQISRVIYSHHDGLIWHIKSDLITSMNEMDSCDSQNGKRFAISGKKQYQELSQYIKYLFTIPSENPS